MTLSDLTARIAYVRKALIQLATLLAALLTLGLLPEPVAGYVSGAIAVIGLVTHYVVPNADDPSPYPHADAAAEDPDAVAAGEPDEYVPMHAGA